MGPRLYREGPNYFGPRRPGASRDLLLQDRDPESKQRYEVELQLGATDESHIIRTLEYWDLERKRYPQYDHCAVIVAEDITSRFLNVISLFNGVIPLMAIQMQAFKIAEYTTLVFTTVVDVLNLGLVDEEEAITQADRAYWVSTASEATVAMVDQLLPILKKLDPSLELKYNKFYVGLSRDGQVDNFVSFRPLKNTLTLRIQLPQSEDIDNKVTEAGLDALEYNTKRQIYRIRLDTGDIAKHSGLLESLMQRAYDARHA